MTQHQSTFRKYQIYLWPAILFLLAWVTFSNTLSHGYVWDDAIAITQNPRTQAGLKGIPQHFEFRDREQLADFNGYRPVTMASHSIDIALFGPNPQAAHGMQVLYFSLLVLVVYFTLRFIFPGHHPAYPFLATLLFLVHPIHVEVVANLKSRDEMLALLFGLLSLRFFIGFVRDKNVLAVAGSALFLLLAALSKENAIALLGVFAVCAWLWGTGMKDRIRGMGLVLGLAGFVVGVFFLLTDHPPGASPAETTQGFIENMLVSNSHALPLGPFDRLVNSGYLFLLYLRNFFLPTELVYYSGYNQIPVLSGFSLLGMLGLLTMFAGPVVFGLMGLRRRHPELVFAFSLFFIPLFIFLQILFLVPDTMADRFLFTPSLGLCWMLAALLPKVLRLDPKANPLAGKPKAATLVGVGALFLGAVLLLGLSRQRNAVWESDLSLFEADLPKLENCGKAHYYLATALLVEHQGLVPAFDLGVARRNGPAAQPIQRAVSEYQRAIALNPHLFYARLELGELLNRIGMDAEALSVLEAAAKTFPDHADPHFYLGRAQYIVGKYEAAEGSFHKALELRPDDQGSMELLGRSYDKLGRFAEGIIVMEEYSQKHPSNVMLLDALSDLYFDGGNHVQSFDAIRRCMDLDPQNPFFWKKIIGRYQLLGDDVSAGNYYQMALQRGVLKAQ